MALLSTEPTTALPAWPVQMRHWVSNKLGVPDHSVGLMTWAEMLHKLVVLQRHTRLCVARCGARAQQRHAGKDYVPLPVWHCHPKLGLSSFLSPSSPCPYPTLMRPPPRDLNEHDIVSRIMRKDNYLIALVNMGTLRLTAPPLSAVAGAAALGLARLAANAAGRGPLAVAATLRRGAAASAEGGGGGGDGGGGGGEVAWDGAVRQAGDGGAGGWSGAAERSGRGMLAWAAGEGGRRGGGAARGWVSSWLRGGGVAKGGAALLSGRRPLMTKTLEWNLKW